MCPQDFGVSVFFIFCFLVFNWFLFLFSIIITVILIIFYFILNYFLFLIIIIFNLIIFIFNYIFFYYFLKLCQDTQLCHCVRIHNCVLVFLCSNIFHFLFFKVFFFYFLCSIIEIFQVPSTDNYIQVQNSVVCLEGTLLCPAAF